MACYRNGWPLIQTLKFKTVKHNIELTNKSHVFCNYRKTKYPNKLKKKNILQHHKKTKNSEQFCVQNLKHQKMNSNNFDKEYI